MKIVAILVSLVHVECVPKYTLYLGTRAKLGQTDLWHVSLPAYHSERMLTALPVAPLPTVLRYGECTEYYNNHTTLLIGPTVQSTEKFTYKGTHRNRNIMDGRTE